MHERECKYHDHDWANYPAFHNRNKFRLIDFCAQGQPDAHNTADNGLGSRCRNSIKGRQGYKKTGTDQRDNDGQIVQICLYNPLADGSHYILTLQEGAQNTKNAYQNYSFSK